MHSDASTPQRQQKQQTRRPPRFRTSPASSISGRCTSSTELDLPDGSKWREEDRLPLGDDTRGGGKRRERRLSRVSSDDEELRRRIEELTREELPEEEGHILPNRRAQVPFWMPMPTHFMPEGEEEPVRRAYWPPPPHAANSSGYVPYPLWDDFRLDQQHWMARHRARQGRWDEDGFGWRQDLAPLYSSLDDDFLWLLRAPPKTTIPTIPDPPPPLVHFNTPVKAQNPGETTYRAEYTAKVVPKPMRARGPKDNIQMAQNSAGTIFPLGTGSATTTTSRSDFLDFHDNWLLDRSLNCRAKKGLASLNRAKPRGGHYYFPSSKSSTWENDHHNHNHTLF